MTSMLFTSFFGVLSAVLTAYIAIRFDLKKARNQELVKKIIQIYDAVAPLLNDILCHAICVGNWSKITPEIVLDHKRNIDRQMWLYKPFFSKETFAAYDSFIHCCFLTYQGWGIDAKLLFDRDFIQKNWGSRWKNDWDKFYAPKSKTCPRATIIKNYNVLTEKFAFDVGVEDNNIAISKRVVKFFKYSGDTARVTFRKLFKLLQTGRNDALEK